MHKSTASFLGMGLAALLSAVADHHKPSVSLDGKWDVTAAIDDFETRDSTLTLSHADGKWKGIMVGEDGESRDFDRVNIDGHTLIIELDVSQNGQNGVLGAKAELQKNGELSGKWYLRGDDGVEYMTNDWEAVRSLANVAAGNWKATAFTPEGDLNYTLNLSKKGSSFNGTVASGQGALELSKVKIDKNTLTTENPYGDGSVKVVAKLTEASKLKGQWFFRDEFGAEVADGEWFANKPSEYAALRAIADLTAVISRNGRISVSKKTVDSSVSTKAPMGRKLLPIAFPSKVANS